MFIIQNQQIYLFINLHLSDILPDKTLISFGRKQTMFSTQTVYFMHTNNPPSLIPTEI